MIALFLVAFHSFAGFSSIAYDSHTKSWGIAYGFDSKESAEQTALSRCGFGCVIVKTAEDECLSLAINKEGDWGAAGSENLAIARGIAKVSCNKQGDNCKPYVYACY